MSFGIKKLIAWSIVLPVASMLFAYGLGYPSEIRLLGDANDYLAIADGIYSFSEVLSYAGDRTIGLPALEYLIWKVVILFKPADEVQAWANAICGVLFAFHIAIAWFFSQWARSGGLIRGENASLFLFGFLGTYPALIGHTTTPLTDTFSLDLVVCALMVLHAAFEREVWYKVLGLAGAAAALLAFSILVRPGNILGAGGMFAAGIALGFLRLRRTAFLICAAALAGTLLLAPYYYNCKRAYGVLCLQSPENVNFLASAQGGLRGARTLWSKESVVPGQIPVLPDGVMYGGYYQRCQLTAFVGLDETSLTGCLINRPLLLPVYVVKKWIGLFDHFRFTPYLENDTPFWLRWLSRGYDALAWLGLAAFFLASFRAAMQLGRAGAKEWLAGAYAPILLSVYPAVLLVQHTALHIEERYGFPLIPLCAVMLVKYGEKIGVYRSLSGTKQLLLAMYFIAVLAVFITQVISWDNAPFY